MSSYCNTITFGPATINYNYNPSSGLSTYYHLLGQDIEVMGHKSIEIATIVSLINVLGKAYYHDIKKQGISLPKEIETFLEENIVSFERDKKISSIIVDNSEN